MFGARLKKVSLIDMKMTEVSFALTIPSNKGNRKKPIEQRKQEENSVSGIIKWRSSVFMVKGVATQGII
jgi:hypothetical protein